MKTILVLYSGDDWKKDVPFQGKERYNHIWNNYQYWMTYSKEDKILVVRASIDWYNPKTKSFKKYWHYDGEWKKFNKSIKPDVIFDKTPKRKRLQTSPVLRGMMKSGFKIYNPPAFRERFGNKLADLHYWSKFMAKSVAVFDKKTARSLAKYIFGDKRFVAKEVHGSGGSKVYIGYYKDIPFNKAKYPLILQEFMKSTGAPGLEGTVSDLRIEYIDHEIAYAYSRVAETGFHTNTNMGAYIQKIPKSKIPKEVKAMAKEMQVQLKEFANCHYALDFFFTKKGPMFIESADVPGISIDPESWSKKEHKAFFKKFNESLLKGV